MEHRSAETTVTRIFLLAGSLAAPAAAYLGGSLFLVLLWVFAAAGTVLPVRPAVLVLILLSVLRIGGYLQVHDQPAEAGVSLEGRREAAAEAVLARSPRPLDARRYLLDFELKRIFLPGGISADASGEITVFTDDGDLPRHAARGTAVKLSLRIEGSRIVSVGEIGWRKAEESLPERLEKLRRSTQDWVLKRLSPLYWEAQVLASSLLIGRPVRSGSRLLEQCRAAGVAHVTALSGLHAAVLLQLLSLLLAPFGSPKFRGVISMGVMLWFLWLTGFRESLVRAALMFCLYTGSRLRGRNVRGGELLGTAALMHVLMFPSHVLTWSWALSYGALCGIICCFSLIRDALPDRIPPALRTAAALTVSASCGTWPVLTALGLDVRPAGLLLSIPSVALVTLFIWTSLVYLAVPAFPGTAQLLRLTAQLLSAMWQWGETAAGFWWTSPLLWAGGLSAGLTLLAVLQYGGCRSAHVRRIQGISRPPVQFPVSYQGSAGDAGAEDE